MSSATLDALRPTCHTEKVNKVRWATGSMLATDASKTAGLISRLRLVDEILLAECCEELDPERQSREQLLRILERKNLLTPWQSSKLLKGDRDGYFLGGYRILYKIAAGSFGRVFRADDPNSGRSSPSKCCAENGRTTSTWSTCSTAKAKSARRCTIPTSSTFLPSARTRPGPALHRDGVRRRRQPPRHPENSQKDRPIEAAQDHRGVSPPVLLCAALPRGLTHRDMKPTNVLLSSSGVAKLVDFGLAEISGGRRREKDIEIDRTIDYAGLERATGVRAGDVRSDIYFLGCIFYEMLTGRPPLPATRDKNVRLNRARFEVMPAIAPGEVEVAAVRVQAARTHDGVFAA